MGLVRGYKNIWYFKFRQSKNAKFTKQSLHTTDRAEAERLSQVFIREHRNGMKEFQDITLKRLRNDIEDYHIKHKSKKSKSNYKIVFNGLENLLNEDYPIKNILNTDIEKYKNKLVEEGKSFPTVNSYLRVVKCIFNKAVYKFKYLKENPAAEVEFLEEPEKQRAFNENEVNFLAENINDELILNTFIFGIYAGCRIGEILNIQWKDIDFKSKTIDVLNNRNFKTKNRKIRQVPISDELFSVIKDMQFKQFGDTESNVINLQNYLFAKPDGNPHRVEYISKNFKKYLRAFGFEENYNFHSTRYSCATIMAKNGVSIYDIQKILGHSCIDVTLKYIKVPTKEMHEAVNRNHIESIRKRHINSNIYKKTFELSNQF